MMTQSPGSMADVPAGDVSYLLRIPPELKERLTEWAKRERRSLNQHIVFVLEAAVDQHDQEQPQERRP